MYKFVVPQYVKINTKDARIYVWATFVLITSMCFLNLVLQFILLEVREAKELL